MLCLQCRQYLMLLLCVKVLFLLPAGRQCVVTVLVLHELGLYFSELRIMARSVHMRDDEDPSKASETGSSSLPHMQLGQDSRGPFAKVLFVLIGRVNK